MKKILLCIHIALPFIALAQPGLKDVRRESYQSFVYFIPADSAEKYIQKDSIPADIYLSKKPYAIFNRGAVKEDSLPKGNYVLLSVSNNELIATVFGVTDLFVYPVNNRHHIQLAIRDKKGTPITDATVYVENKQAFYNKYAQTYTVKQRNPDEAFVKVYAPNDTIFVLLEAEDEMNKSISEQKRINISRSKLGNTVLWLPRKTVSLLKSKRNYYKNTTTDIRGFMIFNQPKYKLTDTVKFKTYIVSKKQKPYKKDAFVYLEYYDKKEQQQQLLKKLSPASAGSFMFSFPLNDTLPNDTRYDIILKNKKKKQLIKGNFNTEDYVLDEVAKYAIRPAKDEYYKNDSLVFYTSATDANGLSLMDAKVRLVVTRETVPAFNKDTVYIPDTLYDNEKIMITEGETRFIVPTLSFPDASISIEATAIFKNSNNELQEEKESIIYKANSRELYAELIKDTVTAEYRINGVSVAATGKLYISGDIAKEEDIHFPFKMKADPFAESYRFYATEYNKQIDSANVDIDDHYDLIFSKYSTNDSAGFTLYNPLKVPVYFTVFDGNKIIATTSTAAENIQWLQAFTHKTRMYRVKWQYVWGNKYNENQQTIALLYKLLDIKIESNKTVFPGQKDTITVNVKDYLARPVKDVNLTAVAYNSQFKKDIRVPDPPYLQRYHIRPTLEYDLFDIDNDFYILKRYPLGNHLTSIHTFGLDTMLYYKMLFPATGFYDAVTLINDFIPEVSVNIVSKGIPQEIYLLNINRDFVYYNGVTDKASYAFPAFEGYSQFGIRLRDKYLLIDSIYLQPNYKHDIVFDLDSLPKSCITVMPDTYTTGERNRIEMSTWQLGTKYNTHTSYIWQGTRVTKLTGDDAHLVGPFRNIDSLHFFAPGNFDIHFKFEPGYEYNLTKQVARLEKKDIFPEYLKEIKLPEIKNTRLILGDTLITPPSIVYPVIPASRFIKLVTSNNLTSSYTAGYGNMYITKAKDSVIAYTILYSVDSSKKAFVLNGASLNINNITPGMYHLLFVTKNFYTAQCSNIVIKKNQLLCIHANTAIYEKENSITAMLLDETMYPEKNNYDIVVSDHNYENSIQQQWDAQPYAATGKAVLQGKIIDKKGGLPIPFALINIKGTQTSTAASADGSFKLNVKGGSYTLIISSVGFKQTQVLVSTEEGVITNLNIALEINNMALNEVVVTSYGVSRKKSLTGSVSVTSAESIFSKNTTAVLSGKAAGLLVSGTPGSNSQILLRGVSSMKIDPPLYVIDGILYDQLPGNITPDIIEDIALLKDAEAISLYGSKAANGVMIITTKTKSLRTEFRDYAFWQPELYTDENGQAKFAVTYPDNITGWDTYIIAIDKKKRLGKMYTFIKSYKPLIAQLRMPQFLLAGDSVTFIGKSLNYAVDAYTIKTRFLLNDKPAVEYSKVLPAKESDIAALGITTPADSDTLKALYSLETTTGFKDGEERKIPVFKVGTEETVGNFWVLQNDTSFSFTADKNAGSIEVSCMNNTLDILLDEIDHIKNYPYYCMEQTASKLRSLVMEKQVKEKLKLPFADEKQLQQLLQKIQKGQLFNGGFSWWPDGSADIYITNYVIEALLPMRGDVMVETTIRNGLLFLQNQLSYSSKDILLTTLNTMSKAKHLIDYTPWLKKLIFDSLTTHQQWLYIQVKQNLDLPHEKELQTLMHKSISGILGSLHWGEENYRWYNNAAATTVLAYEALTKEKDEAALLSSVIQYFLEQRKKGHWNNTVESASIVSAILPKILETNADFMEPALIHISGDTNFIINHFPYQFTLKNNDIKQLNISKTGGGLTYLSVFQHEWNSNPTMVSDNFNIETHFEKNNLQVNYIQSGEKIKMVINVDVKKDAEYVMLEIPIPAGCVYASKNQDDGALHKEFFKNKVLLFTEFLKKGDHHYEIELEPRYTGRFTLNPAKAELMYFPVFYGRNEIKKVDIQ